MILLMIKFQSLMVYTKRGVGFDTGYSAVICSSRMFSSLSSLNDYEKSLIREQFFLQHSPLVMASQCHLQENRLFLDGF